MHVHMHSQILTDAKGQSLVTEIPRIRLVHFCDLMSYTYVEKYIDLSFTGFTGGQKELRAFILTKKNVQSASDND